MKPAPVPATDDRFAWERRRAYLVALEMDRQGTTPDRAAVQADAQLLNEWRVRFPGQELPLEIGDSALSSDSLPGSVQPDDHLTWAILARPRGPEFDFEVTHETLMEMAAVYNPEFRRAAVITPTGRGPTHDTGEESPFLAGTVEGLADDGFFLWGLLADRGGLGFAVDFAGADARSINWWLEQPELEGSPPYLKHLALLTGEQPGISNMPPLTEYFRRDQQITEAEIAAPTLSLSLEGFATREVSMADKPKEKNTQDPPVDPDTGSDVAELVAQALESQLSAPVTAAVKAAMAPVVAELAATKAALAEAKTASEAALAASKASALDARKTRVRTALDHAVIDGRLSAAQRAVHEETLLDARFGDDEVSAKLEAISKLPRVTHAELTAPISFTDDAGNELPMPRSLSAPKGYRVNANDQELAAKALASVDESKYTDPESLALARRAAIYRQMGETPPGSAN